MAKSVARLMAKRTHTRGTLTHFGAGKKLTHFGAKGQAHMVDVAAKDETHRVARAGGARAFDPAKDEPLTMPQAFDGKPASTLDEFKAAVAKAKDGQVSVMTFHGVPDIKHPWVDRKSTRLNSSHVSESRMPSSA